MPVAALVLAAGASRRFGSDKRLHLVDGEPMLARTLAIYRQACADVAVVIRPDQPEIAALARAAGCRVVEAQDAVLGQSRSLAAGVDAMRHADHLIVGLGDMPFVQPDTVRALAAALTAAPTRIVQPTYKHRPGNPIGFPAAYFDELARIRGDVGARQVVAASGPQRIEVDDPGILQDIDHASGASEEGE